MKYVGSSLMIVILGLFIISCGGDDEPIETRTNEELLQEYFTQNNITPQQTASGLYYVIDESGSNAKPTRSSSVTVKYKGYFLNGDVFDSSDRATFSLRQVIVGWTEGIPLFGIGGKGTLYLASEFAYGSQGQGGIPGNTPLIFDVELFDFQ